MIEAIVIALLAGTALAWVAQPLRDGPRHDDVDADLLVEEASAKKDAALLAIVDLEEERELGKLAASDFSVLSQRYEAEAIEAFHTLDALRSDTRTADDDLEAEIAEMRAALTCPACGSLRDPGTACAGCGAR